MTTEQLIHLFLLPQSHCINTTLMELWYVTEMAAPALTAGRGSHGSTHPASHTAELHCDLRFLPGQSLTSVKNHTQSVSGLWEEEDTIGEGDENIDRHKVMLNQGCGRERQAIHTQYGSQKTPACGFSPFLTMRVQAIRPLSCV